MIHNNTRSFQEILSNNRLITSIITIINKFINAVYSQTHTFDIQISTTIEKRKLFRISANNSRFFDHRPRGDSNTRPTA